MTIRVGVLGAKGRMGGEVCRAVEGAADLEWLCLSRTTIQDGRWELLLDFGKLEFVGGMADGFVLLPPYFPGGLADFVDLVVPELQRRGLFRKEYSGSTLRDHLGLKRREVRFADQPHAAE